MHRTPYVIVQTRVRMRWKLRVIRPKLRELAQRPLVPRGGEQGLPQRVVEAPARRPRWLEVVVHEPRHVPAHVVSGFIGNGGDVGQG